MTEECGEIVFWTLRKKFVASSDEMPEHSSQVMYYSLAIGHHVGVIDCLNVAFRCPLADNATSVWQARSIQFIHLLDEIVQEPAIYLMARKIA
ncbi:formate hydrogenlyase maturation HycH family protein [Escherichia coli]|uniref:formate hydrogenlyase maturation HycH family protein n=1 Tax=Escherichia coli TaxID=562 RepID=UPI003CEC6D07